MRARTYTEISDKQLFEIRMNPVCFPKKCLLFRVTAVALLVLPLRSLLVRMLLQALQHPIIYLERTDYLSKNLDLLILESGT